jgi:hypothetical protein
MLELSKPLKRLKYFVKIFLSYSWKDVNNVLFKNKLVMLFFDLRKYSLNYSNNLHCVMASRVKYIKLISGTRPRGPRLYRLGPSGLLLNYVSQDKKIFFAVTIIYVNPILNNLFIFVIL